MTPERAAGRGVRTAFAGMSAEELAAQTRMAMTAQARDTSWHAAGARWGAASDPATAGRAAAEMMTTDLRGEVGRIRTPVLLFMAGHGLAAEQRERMRARYEAQLAAIGSARVVVADEARHFIMLDDPGFFHWTMAAFLEGR